MHNALLARRAIRTAVSATLPVSVVEAELQCNIATGTQDALLTRLIKTARDFFEEDTGGWTVMQSTYTQSYECWPCEEIPLLRRPVSSVTGITYYDTTPAQQTWANTNYRLDAGGAMPRIVYDDTAVLPLMDDRPEAVTVTFVAGSATAADVPEPIRHALLLFVADAFENRGVSDRGMSQRPLAWNALLAPYTRSSYP